MLYYLWVVVQVPTLVIAKKKLYVTKICLSPMDGCQILLWKWWALHKLMKQAKFVAYEQNVIVYKFLTFWYNGTASLVVGAWSKTHNKFWTKKWTITFCPYATNLACFIKFWSPHHVHERICHRSVGEWWIYVIYHKFLAITNLHSSCFGTDLSKEGALVGIDPTRNVR